jgi:hypothetical protein
VPLGDGVAPDQLGLLGIVLGDQDPRHDVQSRFADRWPTLS